MAASLKKQALVLTLANAYTRALGFVLRLAAARLMGAEAMGVMELSSSGIMLAITPVTAGIPTAMSRLTARKGADQRAVLRAGLSLVRRLSALLTPVAALAAPVLAWLLSDWRTLPAMLTSVPLILLLGLCAVYSGWCYGRSDARTPALNECAEQTVRCLLSFALLLFFAGRSVALTAALPGFAEIAAGVAVWYLFWRSVPHPGCAAPDPCLRQELLHLAAPTTAARLCQTALRAFNAVLLPVCLRRSGLSATAATAQFGLLTGMAMPLLMLPGIVTGAICMVATPAVARQEGHPRQLRATMRLLLLSAVGIGLLASAGLFLGAEFISTGLYDAPALAPLLRIMCPAALFMAVQQVQFGLITGLGLQRRALTATVVTSGLSLIITAALCPLPRVRIFGAALASVVTALVRVMWNQLLLNSAIKNAPCIAARG